MATKKGKKTGDLPLTGLATPRVMSLKLKGKSKGEQFKQFAIDVGMPLFPWQEYIANDFLTLDEKDQYIRKTVAVIIARQNGKTHLIALRILAGLFLWGEMSVVAASSVRDIAEDTFEKVCQIIERNDWLKAQVKLTNKGAVGYFGNGSYHLNLKNGAKYEVVAATRDGARGKTADLLFIDELREVNEDAWSALKPTTIARPNAQTYVTSNAGDAFSLVLNSLRDKALSYPSPSLGWYEYSAPPRTKLTDRKGWAQANPSLGYTITEAALEEAFTTSSPEAFRTEHLCQWVGSLQSPWPTGAFEACSDSSLKIEIGSGVTWFAFDVAKSRRSASLVAGQLLPDGRIGVGVLQEWKSDISVDELRIAGSIKEWADQFRPILTLHDKYSTATIAARLSTAGLAIQDISGQQFYTACGDLLDAIVQKRIVHSGQPELIDQMNACGIKENDSSWRIVRRASAGDVSAPISLAMIVHEASKPIAVPAIY